MTATTRHRTTDREATAITTALTGPCGLACAGSVIPGLDEAVTISLLALAALLVLTLMLLWAARWVRERREDRADTLTAARWRAAHAPHLLTATDRAHPGTRAATVGSDSAGVA